MLVFMSLIMWFTRSLILSWGSQPLHNTGLMGNTRPVGLLNVGEDVPRSRQPGGSNVTFGSEF